MLRHFSLCLALLALASGCDSSDPAFDASAYVGTYTGTQEATDSDGIIFSEGVTVTLEASGGTMTLVQEGEDGATFTMTGSYDETGARFEVETSFNRYTMEIEADGDITGAGTFATPASSGTISFDGALTTERFDLTTVTTVSQAASPDLIGDTTARIRTTRD